MAGEEEATDPPLETSAGDAIPADEVDDAISSQKMRPATDDGKSPQGHPRKVATEGHEDPTRVQRSPVHLESSGVSSSPTSILPRATIASGSDMSSTVRKAMRNMPQSVVVITAAAGENLKAPCPLGIAVSSFSTVSLDPPTVSFNVKPPSRTLAAINADGGRFLVHLLNNDRRAAQIAHLFTTGNGEEELKTRSEMLLDVLHQPAQDNGERSRAVNIHDDAVVAILHCELTQSIPVADHMILVAKVTYVEAKVDHSQPLLLYSQGQFSTHGRNISLLNQNSVSANDAHVGRPNKHIIWSNSIALEHYDRPKLRERLLDFVKSHSELLVLPVFKARQRLCALLQIPVDPFGIRLISIIIDAAREAGCTPRAHPVELELPHFSHFNTPLSSSDRAIAIGRSLELLRNDQLFLAMDFEHFFYLVGITPFGSGNSVLASDILEPLRAEGLVAPFQPCEGRLDYFHDKGQTATLEIFEQVEHRLRLWFRTLDLRSAAKARLETIAAEVKGAGKALTMVRVHSTTSAG